MEIEGGKNAMSDGDKYLKQYLKEISAIPLLSPEEEIELAQKIEGGDKEARNKFTQANLKLAVYCAKKYRDRGLGILDLIQEGNIGLIKAVDKFDWRKGNRFSSFAIHWVNQTIGRALENQAKVIRVPVHKKSLICKYRKAKEKLMSELCRNPARQEMASEMNIDIEEIEELERILSLEPVSLDTPGSAKEDECDPLLDSLADKSEESDPQDSAQEKIIRELLKIDVDKILSNCLTAREKEVILMRFCFPPFEGEKCTFGEIAHKLGISRARVQELEKKAIRKLRSALSNMFVSNRLRNMI